MNTEREEGEIYSDLADLDLGAEIAKLREKEQSLIQHVNKLQKDVAKLCGKVTELYGDRENLSMNISELFKTARLEISRKDRRIEELQRQLDDLVFRRNFTRPKRQRDEGNEEFHEAKRSRDDAAPVDVEEYCNRFPKNKNFYRWRNAQKQDFNRSNAPQQRKNFHNQDRNEGRNSADKEFGGERKENFGGEGNCGRFNRNNSPYSWRNNQNQGGNEGRIKEEGDGSNRFNRSKTPNRLKNTHNQRRNSPNVEVGARRMKEETSVHGNVDGEEHAEDNSDRKNAAHPWENVHNQGRNSPNVEVEPRITKEEASAHRNVEREEHCNIEDNSRRCNRENTANPRKNVYNQERNNQYHEAGAKKIKEEMLTHRNMEREENCNVEDNSRRCNRENTANPRKNVHNQEKNNQNHEVGARKIKEETVTHRNMEREEYCNIEDNSRRCNRENTANPWKNVYNQDKSNQNHEIGAKKLKEETLTHGHMESEENCDAEGSSNRNNLAHPWKSIRSQGRNSPNIDVDPKKMKQEASAHRNMETEENRNLENNSDKCTGRNTAYPWKTHHNQSKNSPNVEVEPKKIKEEASTHRNMETEKSCNVENNSDRCNRRNTGYPWKSIQNESRNSPEVELRKIKKETGHTNVKNEGDEFKRNNSPDLWKETQNHDRSSPDLSKNRQKFGKDDTKHTNRHQEDEKHRKEETQHKQKVDKSRDDERQNSKQRHKQSESSRSGRDEKQRTKSQLRSRSKDKQDKKHRSNSIDRHKTQSTSTNEERKERKSSVQDDKNLEDAISEKLEADHHKTIDFEATGGFIERLQEKAKKIDEMPCILNDHKETTPDEAKQKTYSNRESLNIDILRADLNISNDSTCLSLNTSDTVMNTESINSISNVNDSVDRNLTTSFNSSNVSDDSTKKITPTIRRRRCVMSFKN